MIDNICSNSNDSSSSSTLPPSSVHQIAQTSKSNDLNEQCYCLKSRNLDEAELQCCVCARWFHKNCIDIDTGPTVRFMVTYQFFCKNCGQNRLESFSKKQASFHQLCLTALANLVYDNRPNRLFFSRERDIIPFIDKYWEALTCAPRRVKVTWHATVTRTLSREEVFVTKNENGENIYSLRDLSLEKIGPFNENFKTMTSSSSSKHALGESTSFINNFQNGSSSGMVKRGSKRKVNDSASQNFSSASSSNQFANSKKRGGPNDLSRLEKMVPTCFPLEHPFNKDGYRYYLVEPDPNSPLRQKFEETELWAGKPLPGHLYRIFLENKCALSLHDRAPQLKLSDDRMIVTGEKGYSMIRATHGVSHGMWYFEVTIQEKPDNSALRIGWAQKLANLQAPCGYDKFSYSWRSRKGTKFHDSIGKTYSKLIDAENSGYTQGDVLGFLIHLPLLEKSQLVPKSCKNMTLVKFKNHLYYEEKDNFSGEEKKLKPLTGSSIEFYKNGVSQGIAFCDIFKGTYYPCISIYKNATAAVNFGPNFKFPIDKENCKPISDLEFNSIVENSLSDLIYHVSNENTLDV
uniref:Set1 Ash2 histone methyltransferase complex subunit ASH2 n=1 Tax=Brachionus koreanus TaxID=1199090 RepID=A0A4Y6EQW9_9BILA|nr:set1 Ash2 histone methyltransferase complex subunit ASH2 [Brachionus koreanus]